MRTKTLIVTLMALFLAPLILRAQDRPPLPPSQAPDKPQPQGEQPRPAPLVIRRNAAVGTWIADEVAYAPWTITLAVDEGKVTGTVSQSSTDFMHQRHTDITGPVEIYDGFVERDVVSFKCNSPDGGDRTMLFTGKIEGNEIDFTRQVKLRPGGNPGDDGIFGLAGAAHFTATRAQQAREPQPSDPQPSGSQPPNAQPPDRQPSKPASEPAPPDPSPKKPEKDSASSSSRSGAQPTGASEPNYDPFHAAQDMEVGKFYMHKGDSDAAIDRFKHAITMTPNFAEPRMYLGELYEKKGDTAQAIRYYKEFLQILPQGPDSNRIRKRLEKLTKG
jgi:hypothetical protein